MRSQQKQNRRARGNKPQEDDQYGPSRLDEGPDSYSRSQRASHRSDDLRTSAAPTRDYYDGYRETGPHARTRNDEDAWYSDARRYREEDVYRRDDDYDAGMRRDTDWGTRSTSDPQYSSVREDWPHQQYGHPPSYPDSSSWDTAASRDAYDSRTPYYDDWPTPNPRSSSSRARDDDRYPHGGKHGKDSGWSRDHRRDREVQQPQHQTDSGWEGRRRDNGWEDKVAEGSEVVEDRAWEPAPSWKSSHHPDSDNQHRNQHQNNQRNSQQRQQHYSRGGKRNHNSKQQRRDWRNDDSHLNNWTRRDYQGQNRKAGKLPQTQHQPPQNRFKQRQSRSRSRSPVESHHSFLSSRGRSRSPSHSPAPKRRRREASPALRSIGTPSDRDAPGWVPRQEQTLYSRSPSPQQGIKFQHSRHKSVSSASSVSSRRSSRSPSPHTTTRLVHRLPTSEPSTSTPLDKTSRNIQHGNSRQFSSHSNGKYHSHDRRDKNSNADWALSNSIADPSYDDSMPPPSIIPPPRSSHPPLESTTPESSPPPRVNIASQSNRKQPFGFKPITRAQPTSSSSLRKFFPGDDEEAEQPQNIESSPQQRQGYHRAPHPTPPTKGIWPPPEQEEEPPLYQTSAWQNRKPIDYPHTEASYNDQLLIEKSPRPSQDMGWKGDGMATQGFAASNAPSDDLKKSPNRMIAEPNAKPPERSPAPRHIPPSPPFLSSPSTSMVLVGREEDFQERGKATVPPGKPVFSIVAQVGEGTFGKVYKARNSVTNLLVALKRIRMETEKDGFPVTAMREIKLLQSLRHENVVQLFEMIVSNGSVYMVFEYMDHDLTGILSQTQFEFTPAHLKSLCHQMLAGLAYLHHKGVIHRDIKGSNILVNNRGELKLADFGLARFYQKRRRTDYTNRVITLWYRPPELLFGATVYGPEVDMWSAGCIMLELFTKKPVFQGNDEIHQLEVIHKLLGTPNPERWPTLVDLPWYELARPRDEVPNHFREIFQKWMSPAALDLAEKLLAYDPSRRISAIQAMEAPYFTQETPSASLPTGLATLEGEWHELETKRERAKKRKKNEGGA